MKFPNKYNQYKIQVGNILSFVLVFYSQDFKKMLFPESPQSPLSKGQCYSLASMQEKKLIVDCGFAKHFQFKILTLFFSTLVSLKKKKKS